MKFLQNNSKIVVKNFSTKISEITVMTALLASLISHYNVPELHAQIFPQFGSERAGTAIGAALKIGVGARPIGLAESFVAISDDANALFWNPAGIVRMKNNEFTAVQSSWIGGSTHIAGAITYKLTDDDALGITLTNLSVPEIKVTNETNPKGTGETIRFNDVFASLSYSHRFTEQFSAGATLRYVNEILGKATISGFVVDIGTYYMTGLGSSRLAVCISNFGTQLSPNGSVPLYSGIEQTNFQSFTPPTTFRIGFATELLEDSVQRWTISGQLNHPTDNAEYYALGTEYVLRFSEGFPAKIALRTGAKVNAADTFSGGAGIEIPFADYAVKVDFATSYFGTPGWIHRLAASLRF